MPSLDQLLETQIDHIFDQLDCTNQPPSNLYKAIINCTQSALIRSALKKTDGNQTQAAKLLGLNRSVFCKKIKALQSC